MKRIVSLILSVAVLFSICSFVGTINASAMSASDFNTKLSEVRARYPDGCNDDTHTWYVGKTVVGWECHGYARWLSYYVWGVDFANGNGAGWTLRKSTSSTSPINEIEAGNVVRFRRAGKTWNHTIFVTSVDGNTVWYTDCNSDGHDTVKWDQSMSKSALDTALKLSLYGNEAATYGYIAQYKEKVAQDDIHVRDTNYGLDFTAYLKDPSNDHYVFRENHNNTGGYINDVDPVTIHEVYTDGCCKLTYITSAGQYVTAYGKIDWFKTHTHNYVIESEAAHPHKVYEKCYGCGDWYYTGATAENWDSGVVTTSPTCAREGVKTFTCTVANCGATRTEPIARLTTHTWNGGTATKEATYFSEGITTYTCTVCGITKTEPIPQLEIPSIPAKINTCSSNGHAYTLYLAKMTWQQAKEWCERNDGYLATIKNEEEWNTVKGLCESTSGFCVWLGAENAATDSYRWITGEPWTYPIASSNSGTYRYYRYADASGTKGSKAQSSTYYRYEECTLTSPLTTTSVDGGYKWFYNETNYKTMWPCTRLYPWDEGEPNNYQGIEHYLGINGSLNWNDFAVDDSNVIGFIMEAGEIDMDNTYVNTGDQRKDIIGVAKTQIGYREGNDNDTKYGTWYGLPNQPWCAMFITWCADQANVPTSVLEKSAVASPKKSYFNIPYYDGADYTPQSGDLFFTKTWSHVGLVDYVDGEYFYTIEGNTDIEENSETGIGVFAKQRKISDYYFGVPSYNDPITHNVDSNYGTNFTAYLKDPTSDHKVFSDKHGETGGYVNDVDPCTIYEVYTDGCCKFSYITNSGQTVTAFGKYEWFKHDHIWVNGIVIAPSTCTIKGNKSFTCSICSETKTEEIAAKGHTEVIDAAVAATCTETGLTAGKHCSVCNAVLVAQEVVAAKGHTEVVDAAVAPTCTETGLTAGKHCSVCNTVLVAQEVVAAKGHTEVVDAAVAPTCTETGLTAGKHCSVCNAVLVKQEIVKKTGHKWNDGKVTKAATCTADGVKTFTCTVCKQTKTEAISALGHDLTKIAAKAATCTAAGNIEYYVCSRCKKNYSDAKGTTEVTDVMIPAKGHAEVVDAAIAATCIETGLTEGKHCSVCNAVLVEQEVVPAAGHDLIKTAANAATCTTAGNIEYYTCSVCKKTFSDAKGTTEIEKTVVAAAGHSFGEWIVTKEATVQTEGTETRTCSKCGIEETRVIDKLTVVYIPGDVDEDGEITSADARLALRRSVKLENFKEGSAQFLACDVDFDGEVTSADARLILRASVKLEDSSEWLKKVMH